jgi:hypothetical protein
MNVVAQYLQVQIPEQLGFGLFTYGSATPSVDRQEYPWFQTNTDGTPYDINTYVAGEWVGFGLSRPADPRTFEARLTLISGDPAPSTDITGTTLYLTPYRGNVVSLFNGTNWASTTLTELSLATGSLLANTNYDVFVYLNAGVLTLETVAWTGDTTRATELATQDTIYVKSGDATHRYVGTVRTTAVAGTIADTAVQRYIWNEYAPAPRVGKKAGLASSSAKVNSLWNYFDNTSSSNVAVVVGTSKFLRWDLRASLGVPSGLAGISPTGITTPPGDYVHYVSLSAGYATLGLPFIYPHAAGLTTMSAVYYGNPTASFYGQPLASYGTSTDIPSFTLTVEWPG